MHTASVFPEPAWDIARLFPAQGAWSEQEYLDLPGNHLVEFNSGYIEVLEMPSELHQTIAFLLCRALSDYAFNNKLGKAVMAPIPLKLWTEKMREPDVMFLRKEHFDKRQGSHWNGADLVMEVISPSDPGRDKVTKRYEYAKAGIPEYWLIDPSEQTVTVLNLPEQAEEYVAHGIYGIGDYAESATLKGFRLSIQELFSAAQAPF
jgi:Uma2 family endonuclease